MMKTERMTKHEAPVRTHGIKLACSGFGHSDLFRHSSCVIRYWQLRQSLLASTLRSVATEDGSAPTVNSRLKKPPGEGTGPTTHADSRGNIVGRVPSGGEQNVFEQPVSCSAPRGQLAFSLIELIGVLAVIAILAAAAVPALIRQMDRIAGEQESAALKSVSDALQQSILRKRYIPGASDWATNIATELGVDVANVTTNARRQPRFFLIDPALRIGNNGSGLPYNQTNWVSGSIVTNSSGFVDVPLSPRLLILSSIGRALPTNIVSGASTDFNVIWDRNDTGNALPATSFAWTGWPDGDDLKVQRVNLSLLFVHLVLTTNVSDSAYYSIDSSSRKRVTNSITDGYLIKNSVLFLYQAQTNIDSQQILSRDTSFVYDQNVWRSSLSGGSFLAGSLDLGSIVDKYLEAPENTNALNTTVTNSSHWTGVSQQAVVVSNMVAYMNAYNAWAAQYAGQGSWPHDAYWQAAVNAHDSMKEAVQDQYSKSAGNGGNYLPYPTVCPP